MIYAQPYNLNIWNKVEENTKNLLIIKTNWQTSLSNFIFTFLNSWQGSQLVPYESKSYKHLGFLYSLYYDLRCFSFKAWHMGDKIMSLAQS